MTTMFGKRQKNYSIELEFANGEKETIRNLTCFAADVLFNGALGRPVFVVERARVNGRTHLRSSTFREWRMVHEG